MYIFINIILEVPKQTAKSLTSGISGYYLLAQKKILPCLCRKSPELEFLKKSIGARHRVGRGLSYRPARLYRLAEFIPWNRFLGSMNV